MFTPVSGSDHLRDLVTRSRFIDAFTKELSSKRLDAVICPACALPAPPIALSHNCSVIAESYLSLFSYLGMPSGSVPVTLVLEGEDQWDPVRDAEEQDDSVAKMTREVLHESSGLPMGVQVAGLPF